MMRGLLAAVAALVLLPGAAAAQGKMYGELRAGAAFLTDSEFESDSLEAAGIDNVEFSFDTGFLIEAAFGYAHSSGLRGEFALGYRQNDLDEASFDFFGIPVTADATGDIEAVTTMGNVYYDFNLASYGSGGAMANLVPFLGAGIGAAFFGTDEDTGDDSDTAFAYQAIAGMAYNFTPNMAATLSYNYFRTTELESDDASLDYDSHNILIGVRYSF